VPLPFGILNKPSGYTCFHDERQRVLLHTELDFVENKCRILEEIERPPGYPRYESINNYYPIVSNNEELAVCNFISTDDGSGLKLARIFQCNVYELEDSVGHFLIIKKFIRTTNCYIIQCIKSQRRVELNRPESMNVSFNAGAV
jgi:hypothetical protein